MSNRSSGSIAQSVEHGANNAAVVGSSPTGTTFFTVFMYDFRRVTPEPEDYPNSPGCD